MTRTPVPKRNLAARLLVAVLALAGGVVALGSPASAGDGSAFFSLPWGTNETWRLAAGQHNWDGDNHVATKSSLDFSYPGGAGNVRAVQGGIAHVVCSGNLVVIDHDNNLHTSYYHLVNVPANIDNSLIGRGTFIGNPASDLSSATRGCGGSWSGPHVHFALHRWSGAFSASNVFNDGMEASLVNVDLGGWTVLDGAYRSSCMRRVRDGLVVCPGGDIFNDGSIGSGSAFSCPGQYRAEYFANITLSGSPVMTRCEGWPINWDWGGGSPGGAVPADNFSARWTTRTRIESGNYNFIARADDGVKVWLDGAVIIDAWRDQGPTEYSSTRTVSAGDHDIKMEYYERGGGAVAQFRWESAGSGGPMGYTYCANEGQRCNFSGTRDVAYGAAGRFNYKGGIASGVDCNNNVFGDPYPGVAKACYTRDAGGSINTSAWYSVANRTSGKCVDARGGSTANGTAIQQYTCNGTNAQQFQFQPTSDGYYRVANRNVASQVWDVEGASPSDGGRGQLWSYGGGNNQQWKPVYEGNGYYRFVARHSNKCLDVPGSSASEALQLQQYSCDGTGAQSFSLTQR